MFQLASRRTQPSLKKWTTPPSPAQDHTHTPSPQCTRWVWTTIQYNPALLSTSSERERECREKKTVQRQLPREQGAWHAGQKHKNTAMLQSRGRPVTHASCLALPTTNAHSYAAFSSAQGIPFKGSPTRINTGQVTDGAQGVSFKGSPQGCQYRTRRQAEMEWRFHINLLKRNATTLSRPP